MPNAVSCLLVGLAWSRTSPAQAVDGLLGGRVCAQVSSEVLGDAPVAVLMPIQSRADRQLRELDTGGTERFQKAVDSIYAEIRRGNVRHARTIRTPEQHFPTPSAPEDPSAIPGFGRPQPRDARGWLELAEFWRSHDDVARQWTALEAARHALDLQQHPEHWNPEWSWDQDPAVVMAELLPAWEGPERQRDDGKIHGSNAARLSALTSGRFLEDFAGVRAAWQYALQWAPTAGAGRAGRELQKTLLERAEAAGHSFPGIRAGWRAGTAETRETFEPALEELLFAAELELEPLRHELDLAYERLVYEFGRSVVLDAENLAQRERLLREVGAAWESRLDALGRYDQARRSGSLDERAWLDAQQDFLRSTDEIWSRLAFGAAGARFAAPERTGEHSALLERVVRERLRVAIECHDARVASQQSLELAHLDPEEPLDAGLRASVEAIDPLRGLQSPAARDLAAQLAAGVEPRSLLDGLVAARDSFMLDVGARIVLARIFRRAERPLDARLELAAALELAPYNRAVWGEWETLAQAKLPPADVSRAESELEPWIEAISLRVQALKSAWTEFSGQSEQAHAKRSTATSGSGYVGARVQYDLAKSRVGAVRVDYEWLGTIRSRIELFDRGLKW